MGIPSYFTHIVKSHRKIIKEYKKDNLTVDNFYLDSNSIIYDCFNVLLKNDDNNNITNSSFEKLLIQNIIIKIEDYINIISPNKCVYITFDGVAPLAKLSQQRSRRYKSWFQKKTLERLIGKKNNITWNAAAITPGTEFMDMLTQKIKKHFNTKKNLKKFKIDVMLISSSDEIGEGEHKIFKYIRDNKTYHETTTTIIYGLDADLIMLALNHINIAPNLYLYRETPHFIQTIDNTLLPNNTYLIDINKFSTCLKNELIFNFKLNSNKNCICDYVFICFMLGNDFLPHFPALNIRTTGIDTLIDNYYNCCQKYSNFELISKNNRINWRNFREFIGLLVENEYDLIIQEYNKRRKIIKHKNPPEGVHEIEDKLLKLPLIYRDLEEYINPFEKGWESRYYKELFDIDIDDERCKQICNNYLEGLEWTLKYYSGDCADWEWKYKYSYPPLLKDLYKYISYFDTEYITNSSSIPISPLVQLSYVLPRSCLYLLPKEVVDKIGEERIEMWYKDDNDFIWAYCKYFWEAHVIMPNIDINELKLILS